MKPREKCGVVAIRSTSGANTIPLTVIALRALQHRGQESWGFAIPGREPWRKTGLVSETQNEAIKVSSTTPSPISIGHTRYSTMGRTVLENVQPVMIGGNFAMAHNGTICNTEELVSRLENQFKLQDWASDTMIVGTRLIQHLKHFDGDWFRSFEKLNTELNGAFCIIFLTRSGDIYAVRDERGFRPLVLGWHDETKSHVIASESCALSNIGAKLVRDIKAGEMVKITESGVESHIFSKTDRTNHCAFEYTYFAHPSSNIDGVNVYSTRKKLGHELAKTYKISADVVIPVPDSARPAALGFSEATGIPFEEGLMKDRYSKKGGLRSFIEPTEANRFEINKRVVPVEETVRGKDIILVDDSVVRGTSSRILVQTLRKVGVKSISLLSTFPPISHPCYAGIDFPTQDELVAFKVDGNIQDINEINEKVARDIGADFVGYNTLDNLVRGIGISKENLCSSCHTGDYSAFKTKPGYTSRMRKEDAKISNIG